MEKKLRSILLRLLGPERYLAIVSDAFIRLIKAGFLSNKYPELIFLSTLVKPGWVCIDLGANVGYYTVFLSKLAGRTGHVHSVEPVGLFAGLLKRNISKFGIGNVTVHQTALGAEQKKIMMGTPVIEGVFRHGLTKVMDDDAGKDLHTYEVQMDIPDKIFAGLSRLDFIKCDIEGYEIHVLPHFIETIKRFMPLIQIEITPLDHRIKLCDLLLPLGYKVCRLGDGQMEEMTMEEAVKYEGGDFYFKKG